jgi:DNA polymerase-4
VGLPPVIFHVDLDAFYASVECLDDPTLIGRPLVVGARPGHRGVVSSCSYEARRFGIRSAMPISQALRRCPQAVFLPVRMKRYLEVSQTVMGILEGYTPVFQRISIDEAFLDLSGTRRLYGSPEGTGRRIKDHVVRDTGLTLSVGIASNRYVAKIASEASKPDGLLLIRPGREADFLESLPLEKLWGVGEATRGRLLEAGIGSIATLREYSREALSALMGEACGRYLYAAARGCDPGIVSENPRSRSISAEVTFENDVKDPPTVSRALLELSEEVAFRLLRERLNSNTATLKLRTFDFLTTTAQRTVKHWIGSSDELHALALQLLEARWDGSTPLRLVGVGVANVAAPAPEAAEAQGELFDDSLRRKRRVEEAVTRLRQRVAGIRLTKASLLDTPQGRRPPGPTRPAPGPPSGRPPECRRGSGSPPAGQ